MTKIFWEWTLAVYLFLGGLGGGMLTFAMIFDLMLPGSGVLLAMPVFIAVLCLGVGCFFLVFELGQPPVFWRVFWSATAIIKWGAVLLSVALIFGFIYFLSYLPWDFFLFLAPFRTFCIVLAGICGICIMIYTGVLLASLKAHALWATPALPVLFTVSALSTGSAACALSLGMWPAPQGLGLVMAELWLNQEFIHSMLHSIDTILVLLEIVVLLVYILLLRGSGNEAARSVARKWVQGKWAPLFWVGMVFGGLILPLILYMASGPASAIIAPILVLCGGCLLRFMIIYSPERRLIPGEKKFYDRLPEHDAEFLSAWKDKEHMY